MSRHDCVFPSPLWGGVGVGVGGAIARVLTRIPPCYAPP